MGFHFRLAYQAVASIELTQPAFVCQYDNIGIEVIC